MQREEVTEQSVDQWKEIFEEYHSQLKPNRRTGQELVAYLQKTYQLKELDDEDFTWLIYQNIMDNDYLKSKLPSDQKPEIVTYYWDKPEEPVYIGVDLITGFYYVEDDEQLWDELCAFRGLDEADLENFYCVAEYINCLKKFNRLEEVLKQGS